MVAKFPKLDHQLIQLSFKTMSCIFRKELQQLAEHKMDWSL